MLLTAVVILPKLSLVVTLGTTSAMISSPPWPEKRVQTLSLTPELETPRDGHANRSSANSVRR